MQAHAGASAAQLQAWPDVELYGPRIGGARQAELQANHYVCCWTKTETQHQQKYLPGSSHATQDKIPDDYRGCFFLCSS